MLKSLTLSELAIIATMATSPPAHAGDLVLADVTDDGAANRVIAADMMRAFTQDIPAAVCHLHNNVDVEEAHEMLEFSVAAFDLYLEALLHGNTEVGIMTPETRPKTIREIEHLMTVWDPIHDAALDVLADPQNAGSVDIVYASVTEMYDLTYTLLAHIEGEYGVGAELLASDAMNMDIVGRMAAMNQRLAYGACRVWSNGADEELVTDLKESMAVYENSLTALRVGMPALGIAPAPTEEIRSQLDKIAGEWADVHDMLVDVAAGQETDDQERYEIYHSLAQKLHLIEDLEHMYEAYSKRVF